MRSADDAIRPTDPTAATTMGRSPRGPVVSVCGLSKRYGDVFAVERLTFALESGTITGFLGPNGAGKSTTLRMLLGLAAPTAGDALLFGRRYDELEEPTRHVGAMLESGDFHPGRTGRNHLVALALAASIDVVRVDELLELVGLSAAANRLVKSYSLGMRQRLGVASALLGDPELLILDEPANGLDPEGVHWLRGFLRGYAEQGRTVLVSSHALAEVAQTVEAVVVIHRGRLAGMASLAEIASGGRSLEDVYLQLTTNDAS